MQRRLSIGIVFYIRIGTHLKQIVDELRVIFEGSPVERRITRGVNGIHGRRLQSRAVAFEKRTNRSDISKACGEKNIAANACTQREKGAKTVESEPYPTLFSESAFSWLGSCFGYRMYEKKCFIYHEMSCSCSV